MNTDFHNSNFFMAAARTYKANFRNAVFISVGLLAVEWLTTVFRSKFAEYIVPFMLVAMFAYAIHHTILFGANAGWKALSFGKKINRFFLRSLIFFGGFVVIVTLVYLFIVLFLGSAIIAVTLNGLALILLLVIGMHLFGASFALWGTMLPATVAGTDATLPAAWHRAKGNFWYTFLRLALGPFLIEMAILACVLLILYRFGPLDFLKESGAPDPIGILFYLVVQMANLFVTALAASVLCKTYLRSQSEAPPLAP